MRISLTIFLATLLSGCSGNQEDEPMTIPREVEVSPNLVTALGRWTTSTKLDVPLLARINSSNIACKRETMTCTDALAVLVTNKDEPSLNGKLLLSVLDSYTIDTWTDTSIHATSMTSVTDLTLEIDLVGKQLKRTRQETKARGNQTADPTFVVTWELQ